MKRNTIVLFVVLFILAVFAWAGWANWEYRQQAAEKLLASAAKGELVPDPARRHAEIQFAVHGQAGARRLPWKI